VGNVRNPLFDLESELYDSQCMVQVTVMAAEHNDNELTRFGVYQLEKIFETFKRRYYDLFEKHVRPQSV
jgi:hypothetical protein